MGPLPPTIIQFFGCTRLGAKTDLATFFKVNPTPRQAKTNSGNRRTPYRYRVLCYMNG